MDAPSLLSELEEHISRLPLDEQLLLIERVSHRIRANISDKTDIDAQLSEMAADPEIQKELQEIEHEFSATEQDGLDSRRRRSVLPRPISESGEPSLTL